MMLTFVDRDTVGLEDLIAEVVERGPCDIVAGGRTKSRALDRFAEVMRFPDWFGHNLDALYDLLDERAHTETAGGRQWLLLWVPGRKLLRDHPADYRAIVSVLADVADPDNTDPDRGARVVVVHGPDPATSTPQESPRE